MTWTRLVLCSCLGLLALTGRSAAEPPPSYARQVKPFLARYCLECHNADAVKGGLNMESYKALQAGGEHGPVLKPGKPDESRLVLLAEGKAKPAMPPRKARQPTREEVALLRAWVAAGAPDDATNLQVVLPDIKPRGPAVSAIAALAYRPDGKLLAAGAYQEVVLLDVATGDVIGRLPGQAGEVTALAFSSDGKRLLVAGSATGRSGEVRIYTLSPQGVPTIQPDFTLAAHRDAIYQLALSPDGKLLATCSYDRLVKLWDVVAGKELRTLKDHSDAIYWVAFSADGQLLASASADRAVKVWDVATGTRLYTLGESTDWVYAVAWSPDGRHLAAAGVDKSIRVWEAGHDSGKLIHSVFAHEGPITRLVYGVDGLTLYSLGEDRVVKAWDAGRMVERRLYSRQPEATLALAVRPDQKQLALGRYDGALLLVDEATGQVQSEPLPVKPKPPQLARIAPSSGRRGHAIRLLFEGKYLDGATELTCSAPNVTAKLLPEGRTPGQVKAELTFPADTPAGVYQLGLKGAAGSSNLLPFTLDLFDAVTEMEPNDSPSRGQTVPWPTTIVGGIGKAGDVDFYRLDAPAGRQIGVQVLTAALGSKLEPVLQLTDASGNILAESSHGTLGYTCPRAGILALGIRDRDYRGGPDMFYRLHVGDIPVVTALFPLGLQRGSEADIEVAGVNLGTVKSAHVKAPASAAPGTRLPVAIAAAAPGNTSVVGEFPEVTATGPATLLPVPGTANGRIEQPGATGTWRFEAHKGQRLILEVEARRLASPLDSYIEILDARGQPVPRAVLRCLAKTYTTFRDHDSSTPGIRLETWNALAMNDYLLAGGELMRIHDLPRMPDDDCQFFSMAGQRRGFLDTTPMYHSLATPLYKVEIHPPGTTFSPNGLPVVTVNYRNDDGGPGYGKDSRLFFDPPADGPYLVRIGDSRGQGGPTYGYRLTVRPPRPAFKVSFTPTTPAVWKGGAIPISVTAERRDGFEGPIEVRLVNLPVGFSAPATTIPAGETTTAFALATEASVAAPTGVPPLKLIAHASINGQDVVQEAIGGVPKVVEPGDIVTSTEQPEVVVKPGGQVVLMTRIERRHGFAGRVPLDVRGLPHGVRVLDVGLNGILITEKENSRAFVLYCEPWVQPMNHPFVVLARHEGKSTEHAAPSVLLKIIGP